MADQEMEEPASDQQRTPARGRRGRRGGRGRGRGTGRDEEPEQEQGLIREQRRRREEGRNGEQIIVVPRREDRAIREVVEDGVWKAKCFTTRKEADWGFETKVAACVAFDVSHIIAMEKGWAKAPRKGGIFFHTASPALLHDLVDVDMVTRQENRLLRTTTHVGRLVDDFLASLPAEEPDPESATFPVIPNGASNETNMLAGYDYNIEHCCFRLQPRRQRPARDVPGLAVILAVHRGDGPLPDNPTGADFGYPALLPRPEETLPEEEPRRAGRPSRRQTKTPLRRQDGTGPGKKNPKQDDGGGGGGPPPPPPLPLPPEVQEGPYLVLEVETSCPQHGERVSKHYHFAHDCVCEAKSQMRDCFEYINLDPTFRSYLNDFELPKCFQDWKYRLHTQPEPG